MVETLQGGSLEHTQLGGGCFHGRLTKLCESPVRLDYGEYNLPILARGQLPDDRITLGFLEHSPGSTSFNGLSASSGNLVLWTEGAELHTRLSEDCRWACLQIRREVLEGAGIELPGNLHMTVSLGKNEVAVLKRDVMNRVRACSHPASGQLALHDGELSTADIEDAFVSALNKVRGVLKQGIGSSPGKRACNALPMIRRFEDYVDAHIAEPVTISRICADISYPLHSLERLCMKVHGVTPKQFLHYRRLSALRALLVSHAPGDITVADAAHACGLTHLGRTSASFQRAFGEKPSETLRASAPLTRIPFSAA
jgi:AraC-like DNA-binding protein